uniref:DUF4282 domain-containing protein n=1 Tax=Desulfovibrio sp. U5L TaxID=596152 RepID=I2Q2N1_9BACT
MRMSPWKIFRSVVLWAWTAFCLLTAFTVFFSTHRNSGFYGTLAWAVAQIVAWGIPFLIIRTLLRLASLAWARTIRSGDSQGKAALAMVNASKSTLS